MHSWTIEQAADILTNSYSVNGQLTRLEGEWGGTFRVDQDDGITFLLKCTPDQVDRRCLELENITLAALQGGQKVFRAPQIIKNKAGVLNTPVDGGIARLFSWIPGRVYAEINPRLKSHQKALGIALAGLKEQLGAIESTEEPWSFDWAPHEVHWVQDCFELYDQRELEIVSHFLPQCIKTIDACLPDLPVGVNYNDANDYNIVVSQDDGIGFIDFGDMQFGPSINDLAICLAYVMMRCPAPLDVVYNVVSAYHARLPLTELEMQALMPLSIARLLISATKAKQRAIADPDNDYWQISATPAWELLAILKSTSAHYCHCLVRYACRCEPCPKHDAVTAWLTSHHSALHPVLGFPAKDEKLRVFDWSAGSLEIPNLDYLKEVGAFTEHVFTEMQRAGSRVGIGRYNEPRLVYSTDEYAITGTDVDRSRTVHLGLDIFMPPGTPLYAPMDGEIITIVNDAGDKEYGPLLILRHAPEEGIAFYTLYGHNSMTTLEMWKTGDHVNGGQMIAEIGDHPENGNWVPHLHFQIITDLLDYRDDFPGVSDPEYRHIWTSISPDPNLMLGLDSSLTSYRWKDSGELLSRRKSLISPNLSVSYAQPLHIVRGWKTHLFTEDGRRYLDTRNNISHVGHEHPAVTEAGSKQMAVLNTNTRYLHDVRLRCAEQLLARLPDHLTHLFFVNSGSEANDLALRIARHVTGSNNTFVLDQAYHGHTQAVLEVSPYKFKGKGGFPCPPHVHILPAPDMYRGQFAHARDAEELLVLNAIEKIAMSNASTFIHESLPSCAGQLVPPHNYFREVYKVIWERNGVCIADEVQTGMGRVGEKYWAFEIYDIRPDIVTIGKPLGNGHPVAAVAVSNKLAEEFDNGMEYFNSFGGNPVSCAIANAVMKVMEDEKLQAHASKIGKQWKVALLELQSRYPVIGDVRGFGLFLGVEFSQADRIPAPGRAAYFSRRMLDHQILTSLDGPFNNVLKIKPPMSISEKEVEIFMHVTHKILAEDPMQL